MVSPDLADASCRVAPAWILPWQGRVEGCAHLGFNCVLHHGKTWFQENLQLYYIDLLHATPKFDSWSEDHFSGLWSLEASQNNSLLHIIVIRIFGNTNENKHQCLRCTLRHFQWSQPLPISLANPHIALIELHNKCQLIRILRYVKLTEMCLTRRKKNSSKLSQYYHMLLCSGVSNSNSIPIAWFTTQWFVS